jgi:hypothetical protein
MIIQALYNHIIKIAGPADTFDGFTIILINLVHIVIAKTER